MDFNLLGFLEGKIPHVRGQKIFFHVNPVITSSITKTFRMLQKILIKNVLAGSITVVDYAGDLLTVPFQFKFLLDAVLANVKVAFELSALS